MTARDPLVHDPRIDAAAVRLAELVRPMLAAEARALAQARRAADDDEIMGACSKVAEATDRLAAARYTRGEIAARAALEQAGRALREVMRKHGRYAGIALPIVRARSAQAEPVAPVARRQGANAGEVPEGPGPRQGGR